MLFIFNLQILYQIHTKFEENRVQVALERFIDDVVVQIVDVILIRGLEKIFSPVAVSTMPVNLVTEIAGESEESRTEREQLTKQLDILMKGSETCKRFIGERALGMS